MVAEIAVVENLRGINKWLQGANLLYGSRLVARLRVEILDYVRCYWHLTSLYM